VYSKEESKKLRKEFWIAFGRMTKARKKSQWLLYNTNIKDVSLKFVADRKICAVAIDIELKNEINRHDFYFSMLGLKLVFDVKFENGLVWEKDFILENDKIISRIFYKIENVDIYNKDNWSQMFKFLFKNMKVLESLFIEYEDVINEF
jgi:hypothetical protein